MAGGVTDVQIAPGVHGQSVDVTEERRGGSLPVGDGLVGVAETVPGRNRLDAGDRVEAAHDVLPPVGHVDIPAVRGHALNLLGHKKRRSFADAAGPRRDVARCGDGRR